MHDHDHDHPCDGEGGCCHDDEASAEPLTIPQQIEALCEHGNDLSAIGEYDEALAQFRDAWALLPEPRGTSEASLWLLGTMGDMEFQLERFEAARDHLLHAFDCPEAASNPFLHLRLGQCHYELGQSEAAADALVRAFLLDSPDIFDDEDPKYLALVRSRLDAPPSDHDA
jgi:tetratricopeptide (TPR) repeat protein